MAVNSTAFPAKEQAIILNATDDIKLIEYVVAVGNIVGPKNILFASRVSNGRICIYLSSKSLVDEIVSNHPLIIVKDKEIGVRRLINPARRIILSNVCPSIPHKIFENQIKTLGYNTVSPMTFLRAGIGNDEYGHVLSFRRQIHIQPNDAIELPPSIVLKYENTNYRVFLSFDDVCFKCKTPGHFANECPTLNTTPTTTTEQESSSEMGNNQPIPPKEVAGKRQNVEEESPEPEKSSSDFFDKDQSEGRRIKKLRASDSTESLTPTPLLLLPVKQLIDNASTYPLNFDQTVEFMDRVVGEKDILGLLSEYTEDFEGVRNLLYDMYPTVEHNSIRSRLVKVQRKLKKAIEKSITEDPENMCLDLSRTRSKSVSDISHLS